MARKKDMATKIIWPQNSMSTKKHMATEKNMATKKDMTTKRIWPQK